MNYSGGKDHQQKQQRNYCSGNLNIVYINSWSMINWNYRQQSTEAFIPRIVQYSWSQKFWHTRANYKGDVANRFWAGSNAFRECALAKQDTNYMKTNLNKKCANCLRNHGDWYLGCPRLQTSKGVRAGDNNSSYKTKHLKKQKDTWSN